MVRFGRLDAPLPLHHPRTGPWTAVVPEEEESEASDDGQGREGGDRHLAHAGKSWTALDEPLTRRRSEPGPSSMESASRRCFNCIRTIPPGNRILTILPVKKPPPAAARNARHPSASSTSSTVDTLPNWGKMRVSGYSLSSGVAAQQASRATTTRNPRS